MRNLVFGLALLLAATPVFAQENPDIQSEEEIAKAEAQIAEEFKDAVEPSDFMTASQQNRVMDAYAHLDPNKLVPADLLKNAVNYFDANKARFKNQDYLTVVDFKPRSNLYRFFLVDLKTGAVTRFRTTHGAGSDANNDGYAESFGNVEGSSKSSLGFARTAEVYSGNFGRSLRLDGLSSTNSNIRRRAVVFHGWDYVKEANVLQGLSKGCITMDWNYKDSVLEKIKGGSLLYTGVSQ